MILQCTILTLHYCMLYYVVLNIMCISILTIFILTIYILTISILTTYIYILTRSVCSNWMADFGPGVHQNHDTATLAARYAWKM